MRVTGVQNVTGGSLIPQGGNMKVMKRIHAVSECMRSNRIHLLTTGFLCSKTLYHLHELHGENRLFSVSLCLCG